jgi:hypothetical protein
MPKHSIIYSAEPDDERWSSTSPRQHAIQQQTSLKAIAIGQTRQLT